MPALGHLLATGPDAAGSIRKADLVKQAFADALQDRGYTTLTPVQEAVTEPALEGRDLLVSAQTGSGKTLGFGLAIAPTLLGNDEQFGNAAAPLALVIAPTRELAMQVKRELSWLYAKAGASLASCVGGMDMRDERRALDRGAHIVVATPGRLRDHIMRGSIDLGAIRAVVLDEADEMLDLGFREDLEFILGEAPDDRQTLMFSATVPNSIASLAKSYQKDAQRVVTKSGTSQHADIEYRAMQASERDAENAIINTLRYFEAPNAIVFCNTRAMVNRLTTRMSNRGFSVVALSGELSQNERTHALQAMRDGRARVCVATDVAARGIDLPNLDLVIHAELPSNHETLLHRSGRTGRAGRKGVSALIVTPKVRKKAERILKWAKLQAAWIPAPGADDVKTKDQERLLSDPAWWEDAPEGDSALIADLTNRFSPEQIAAAYLRLYHAQHSAPEELSAFDAAPEPRQAFGPSVWFAVEGGRAKDAEPRRLLPMLCKLGDITKADIGAIRIQADVSWVEIKETSVPGFLAAIGPDMVVEDGAKITQLATPPVSSRPDGGSKGPREDRSKPRRPKPEGKFSRPDRPVFDKPEYRKPAAKAEAAPQAKTTPGTTAPVDWNDDPAPRVKKPKPSAKTGANPGGKKPAAKPAKPEPNAPVKDLSRMDPSKSFRKGKKGGNGPKPPMGKSNSKKNKLRAKPGGKPIAGASRGGSAPPRRGK